VAWAIDWMMKMFKNAVAKLTMTYVVVLSIVCLIFSLIVFATASRQLRDSFQRQQQDIQNLRSTGLRPDPQRQLLRQDQLAEDNAMLVRNIFLTNIFIIGIGSFVCYLFAKKTLEPIEDMYRSQSQFASDASHELRTPLAVMRAEIEVAMLQEKLSKSETTKLLTSNLEEINRMQLLSENLLALARKSDPDLEDLNINETFDLITKDLRKAFPKAKIVFDSKIADSDRFRSNRILIQQIFNILVDNSVKYNDKKSTQISINISKKHRNVQVVFLDNGPGIKPSNIDRVFNRFYRGDDSRTKQKVDGHGLGLSLAQEIIKSLGGSISARNSKKGTEFVVILSMNIRHQ
jgi:signal transduction histidine kinase